MGEGAYAVDLLGNTLVDYGFHVSYMFCTALFFVLLPRFVYQPSVHGQFRPSVNSTPCSVTYRDSISCVRSSHLYSLLGTSITQRQDLVAEIIYTRHQTTQPIKIICNKEPIIRPPHPSPLSPAQPQSTSYNQRQPP